MKRHHFFFFLIAIITITNVHSQAFTPNITVLIDENLDYTNT